ncbi:MAG: L-serine ammonia-lyase [Rubricella sp.]
MFVSVFEMFKIGIGPSSSHTMGPMIAAARFLDHLREHRTAAARIDVRLHGSLAFTGKGHATDSAVILGLAGHEPRTLDPDRVETILAEVTRTRAVTPGGLSPIAFDPATDLVFDYEETLPGHTNGLAFRALDGAGHPMLRIVYYSVGGGFVLTEAELAKGHATADTAAIPYPFKSAAAMLDMARDSGLTIAAMKRANETAHDGEADIDAGLRAIWGAMAASIDRGFATEGILPGGLSVRRRAPSIRAKLLEARGRNMEAPHRINDWVAAYAMAVNEENAAGGRIVTAPTNGAAGVVPAVIRYWLDHVPGASEERIADFLLTAAAIGGLVKFNASISGAEAGCQAEVGSASAMAAAGLCAVLGGTPEQIENAAEIALEHHLGMTCDPVKGLVQVPCIERNGLGAIKAIAAASLALCGDGSHCVPLDSVIETMRQTGLDMSEKYKETALGGLAVNLPNC